MKAKIASLAFAFLTLIISSCSSDDNNKAVTPTPTPAASGFKWKENGGAEITADAVYFESAYHTIKASKGTSGSAGFQFVEINLTAATAATYTVGSGNAVGTLAGYGANAGSIIITSNASGKMSGTVTSTGSGNGVNSLDATFTDIEVR